MPQLIERRDLDFLLHEVLRLDALCAAPRFAMHDRASFDSVLDAAQKIAEEEFLPHAAKLDANEPQFDGSRVALIPEVKQALGAYVDGGFIAAAFPIEDGGLQLPYTLTAAAMAYFTAANAGTAGYPFLTAAAANLQRAHASDAQKARYMKPMLEGRWFGTMCLSEPQAGSSLGDIRTRAIPQPDGRYHLVGNKMWISGADHELAENIVHHVLARIDGAPAGVKGISLFIVPKYRVDEDGKPGARNGVHVAGLNHKMGYRGTVNAALNFGESEPAVGELIGAPNQGLACMFHMMNEARIGVGMGAAALGYAGYRYSLAYARQRPQGRPIANKDPASKPVAIIEHSDVRRMLLQQKAYVEGALMLCLYCARLVDEQAIAEDEAQREAVHQLLEVLTPIAKSWPSEFCLEANKIAIQVLGGYGYTRDYPLERLYRDNRLNPIHEGTTGIQALDLLGRKVLMNQGAAFRLLLARMTATADEAVREPALAESGEALRHYVALAGEVTLQLAAVAARDVERFVANATAYLEMLGHIVIAWMWLRQALVAQAAEGAASPADRAFYLGKRQACRYFFRYELPKAARLAELLKQLDDTCLAMPLDAF
ncbi:acyl-CoA dehydrogenase [Solimonas soli]|uniref:acyl-CoA dehydrogenase n=1 Tax=Solimonas soli TaxID=413479 RepID=UPI0004811466|nr:acyl-CoA dehydrogenase [Solimonas soli]